MSERQLVLPPCFSAGKGKAQPVRAPRHLTLCYDALSSPHSAVCFWLPASHQLSAPASPGSWPLQPSGASLRTGKDQEGQQVPVPPGTAVLPGISGVWVILCLFLGEQVAPLIPLGSWKAGQLALVQEGQVCEVRLMDPDAVIPAGWRQWESHPLHWLMSVLPSIV